MEDSNSPISSLSEAVIVRIFVSVSTGAEDSDAVRVTVTMDCHIVDWTGVTKMRDGDRMNMEVSDVEALEVDSSVVKIVFITVGVASELIGAVSPALSRSLSLITNTTAMAAAMPRSKSTTVAAMVIQRHSLRRYHGWRDGSGLSVE